MGKRNGEKGDWVAVLEGAGHLPPGVYKRSRVAALLEKPGVRYRAYRTQADAQRGFRHLVSQNGRVPAGEYLAFTDGSYKEGAGSASAVLLDPRLEGKGREVALARAAFPWPQSAEDAEVRGILLALALVPKGARLRLETDYLPLAEAWRGKRHANLISIVSALKELVQALGVEVEIVKVARSRVERAHREAGSAREGLPQEEEEALRVRRFLEKLPVRFRLSALELLEAYQGEEPLEVWLARGNSETRKLLLDLFARLHPKEREGILRAVRSLPEAVRRGLKEVDRELAWGEKPATPKQLAFLRALGYRGEEPGSVAEASRLIQAFLDEGEAKTRLG